uniref:LysM domain-containing protein n=1 Tax=Candidatus Kentrum sp. LFY TaxID=2126342 RepID=A0A450UAN9_9GAMM|nr:MAG: LysM domain-containing protein [Candidatus Kentron sp. LFY]
MENTDPKFKDDWQLEKPPHSQRSDGSDGQSRSTDTGFSRQVITVGSVIIMIAAVIFLILNTIIAPVQNESKEIKEMISTLRDLRGSDLDTLQARLDKQEGILTALLKKVSGLKDLKSVIDEVSSEPMDINTQNSDQYTLYVIQKNDTLGEIAQKHNVTVKRIMEENEIKNRHKISIGQGIYIPSQ